MGVPATTPGSLAPRSRVGRYEILDLLAIGGMAELYLARATGVGGFEKVCVVKRVLPHHAHDPEFAEMFVGEARLAAALHHENIVQVTEIGAAAGEYFFVMEYLHGKDVRTILRERKSMALPVALAIAMAVARGLHHAHEQTDADGQPRGLVHRDVSPSNVIVTWSGGVKLVDFGIAKSLGESRKTRTGVLKGKIGYMSPEQCHDQPVDRRSDVFALGVLLYEMTTGRRLFAGDNPFAVMNKIVAGKWTRPSKLVADYPSALEAIVERALQVEPERRYATAEEMRAAVDTFSQAAGVRTSTDVVATFMKTAFDEPPYPKAPALVVDSIVTEVPPRSSSRPVVFAIAGVAVLGAAVTAAAWAKAPTEELAPPRAPAASVADTTTPIAAPATTPQTPAVATVSEAPPPPPPATTRRASKSKRRTPKSKPRPRETASPSRTPDTNKSRLMPDSYYDGGG